MKTISSVNGILSLGFLLALLVLFSCAKEEVEQQPEKSPESIVDTYKYIAVNGSGAAQLYEIGDNSGTFEKTGLFAGIEFNLVPNALTTSESSIYSYQQLYDPHIGKIFVYEKATKQVKSSTIDLSGDFGQFAVIIGLDWDEMNQSLIGIINDNYLDANAPNYVVRINPETYQIEDLDIEFFQKNINSSLLRNSTLYVSSFSNEQINDFNQIDLSNKEVIKLAFENPKDIFTGLSKNTVNNTLFAFYPLGLEGYTCSGPVSIDLTDFNVKPISADELICVPFVYGKGFYHQSTNEHIAVVNLTSRNPNPNALLRYDVTTKKPRITELKDPEGDSNALIIIDAIKL